MASSRELWKARSFFFVTTMVTVRHHRQGFLAIVVSSASQGFPFTMFLPEQHRHQADVRR